jgi:hypothetical protein
MCRGELNLNNQASHINIDFQRFPNFTINYATVARVKLSKFSLNLSVGDTGPDEKVLIGGICLESLKFKGTNE